MFEAAEDGLVPEVTIADRLRIARERIGVSRADFAQQLGIGRNTVLNYEHGNVRPRRPVVVAWALRTGISLSWLETGMAKPRPAEPDGASVRPEGFEPPTFCFGADEDLTSGNVAAVLPFRPRRSASQRRTMLALAS